MHSPPLAFTGLALAEKPKVKPYAAGAPYGGIPLWNPGEKFIGVSGGTCSGTCPVYELYVFDDGRVVFNGRKDTSKVGVWNKKVAPEVYAELLTMIVQDQGAGRGNQTPHLPQGTFHAHRHALRVGCRRRAHGVAELRLRRVRRSGQADRGAFIDSTGVDRWLAPKK